MTREMKSGYLTVFMLLLIIPSQLIAWDGTGPLVIDHNCSDLSKVPLDWVDAVQANLRLHYAHTSHGHQLTRGLEIIEGADPSYNIALEYRLLPVESDAFCIFDGQEELTYVTPEEYWNSAAGMNKTRSVLANNSTINITMFGWCYQMDGAPASYVQAYLDSMSLLEAEDPDLIVIYFTGHAQTMGWEGWNRHQRNEQIRQFCIANNKILFDFADLDSWWFNPGTQEWEFETYEYDGETIPVEHPQYSGDEWGHTTLESCELKGRATWWMFSEISGWNPTTTGVDPKIVETSLGGILKLFKQQGSAAEQNKD